MKILTAELEVSAPDLKSCPSRPLPEFALIGRSNVGKSSLINLITGRNDLARVSGTPGKTQLINFFLINGKWRLVDLPGYGYAKLKKERRIEFNYSVAEYLAGRNGLSLVYVLIDSRHEPQAIDLEFLQWLHQRKITFALIFTKTDKQSASQTHLRVAEFKRAVHELRGDVPEMLLSSAHSKAGRSEILASISAKL